MMASNDDEDGGGDFPRKSEVSTYFSSVASGAGWSDAPEGSTPMFGGMLEAMENQVKDVSLKDSSLLVGIPSVDDGKLEHDTHLRRGVAGDLKAVVAVRKRDGVLVMMKAVR